MSHFCWWEMRPACWNGRANELLPHFSVQHHRRAPLAGMQGDFRERIVYLCYPPAHVQHHEPLCSTSVAMAYEKHPGVKHTLASTTCALNPRQRGIRRTIERKPLFFTPNRALLVGFLSCRFPLWEYRPLIKDVRRTTPDGTDARLRSMKILSNRTVLSPDTDTTLLLLVLHFRFCTTVLETNSDYFSRERIG